jgi:hypothetical protein
MSDTDIQPEEPVPATDETTYTTQPTSDPKVTHPAKTQEEEEAEAKAAEEAEAAEAEADSAAEPEEEE